MTPRLILVVIAPFGAGYFLSLFFRNTNAVLAPELARTFNLDAYAIGILTSVFFLTAALQYVPLALLLDRYGPRRLFVGQILVTAVACYATARADSFAMLVVGRALLGLGLAACLTTAFKGVTVWFPRDRLATANGLVLFAGALGALAATRPLQIILDAVGWRDMFLAAAVLCAVVALAVYFVMPEGNAPPAGETRSSLSVYRELLSHPVFWRAAPAASIGLAGFFTIQSLWANGWMSDVAGLDQVEIGRRLFALALAMVAGTLGNGALIDQLARRGIDRSAYLAAGLSALLFAKIAIASEIDPGAYWPWLLLGFTGNIGALVHPILNLTYRPAYAARSISTIAVFTFVLVFAVQSGIGFVLDLWGADAAGRYPAAAYRWGFGGLVAAEAVCIGWLVLNLGRLRHETARVTG
jgi:predicted MFS family arabinose efflux permease